MAELLRQDRLRVEDIQMRLSDDADEKKVKKHKARSSTTDLNMPMNQQPAISPNWGTQGRSTVGNQ